MSRDAGKGHEADAAAVGPSYGQSSPDAELGSGPCSVGRSLSVWASKSRPSLRQAYGGSIGPTTDDVHQGTNPSSSARQASLSLPIKSRPTRSSVPKTSSGASTSSHSAGSELRKGSEAKNTAKSSSALRESIAKAKAARKAALPGNAKSNDPFDNIAFEDPFGQKPKSNNKSVLRNRVATARKSGHLNVSALALREIPHEVMTMYDFDPESSGDWYENVDLVKFIAADNEIETLSDAAFPDIDLMSVSLDDDVQGGQFGGLEVLDFHGNLLSSLPKGLRRLQRLQTLNLSNNKLTIEVFDVVSGIQSLTELRLANNDLVGSLPPSVGNLCKLEVLDLHGNSLTELRGSLQGLSSLRVMNVAENRLAVFPFDEVCDLPLTEINAQKNSLTGYLIPASVDCLTALQTLNVTGNNLERLSEGVNLSLPSLRQLFAAGNRIDSLPDVSSWQALLTINMEDNKLSEIPAGFPSLKNLKHCDFTGCDIRILDNSIGLMDNLVSFRVANNPLRERKFLSMDTEDLKLDLRGRCAPGTTDTEEDDGSVQTEFTMAPESPPRATGWRLKPGGILDRSSTEASELDCAELRSLACSADVRCLYLRRNMFEFLPVPGLSLIAHSLADLDLSYNPLNAAGVITQHLSLPHLQSLTISACKLNSLDPLLSFVSAPSLTFLDVSNNVISGPLPAARKTYPNLVTFIAAENQIESLDFEAVRGLQVLDVSNNNIGWLPPKLGLLSPEEVGDRFPGLRRLDVSGNSFRVPRWQIVSKGTEAVLEWLKNRVPDEELQQWQDEGV